MMFVKKVSSLLVLIVVLLTTSLTAQDKIIQKDGTELIGKVFINEVNPIFAEFTDPKTNVMNKIQAGLIKEIFLENGDKYTSIKYKVSPTTQAEILGFTLVEGDVSLYRLKSRFFDSFIVLKSGEEIGHLMLDKENKEGVADVELVNYKIILFQKYTSLSNEEKADVKVAESNLFHYTSLHNERMNNLIYQKESLKGVDLKPQSTLFVYGGVFSSNRRIETLNLYDLKPYADKYILYNTSGININLGFEYYIEQVNALINESYTLELNYTTNLIANESTTLKEIQLSEIELSLGFRLNVFNYKQFRMYGGFAPGITYQWLSEKQPFKSIPDKEIKVKSYSFKNYTTEFGIKVQPIVTWPLEVEIYAQGLNREHEFFISDSHDDRFDPMYIKANNYGVRIKYAF